MWHHRSVAFKVYCLILLLNKSALQTHHLNILGHFFEVHCCGRHVLKFNPFNPYSSVALSLPLWVFNLKDCLVIATLDKVIFFSFFQDLFEWHGIFFLRCMATKYKSWFVCCWTLSTVILASLVLDKILFQQLALHKYRLLQVPNLKACHHMITTAVFIDSFCGGLFKDFPVALIVELNLSCHRFVWVPEKH